MKWHIVEREKLENERQIFGDKKKKKYYWREINIETKIDLKIKKKKVENNYKDKNQKFKFIYGIVNKISKIGFRKC